MKLKFTSKKRSVIYSWTVSYILILLIPTIITGFVYFIAKNTIEEEINSSNEAVLERIRDNIDNSLSNVERFSLEVATNQKINIIASLSRLDNGSPYYSIYEAASELKNYKIFSSYMKRYYVYLNNIKTVLGAGTTYSQKLFYDEYLSSKDYSMEQWLETMGNSYVGNYIIMPLKEEGTQNINTIAYVKSLPIPSMDNIYANFVIQLNFKDVLTNNGNQFVKGRTIKIISQNDMIVSENGIENNSSELKFKDFKGETGRINKAIDSKKVVMSYTTSRVNKWKYVTITPEYIFWEKAQKIRNLMFGGWFACLLLGGITAFFFLRRNYNPLKEIVTFFQEKTHQDKTNLEKTHQEKLSANKKNQGKVKYEEYGVIQQAFENTLEQKETISQKLEQQNKYLKENLIASLLKGRETIIPIHELLTNYNISFLYSHFTVMTIFIESMDEDFWIEAKNPKYNKYELSRFVIKNVVEELININCYGFVTEVDNMMVCLINTQPDIEIYKSELLKVTEEARSFLELHYKMILKFGAGLLHDSIPGIHEAYKEAIDAIEYIKVMGITKSLVIFDEIINETSNKYYYPTEKEYQLINCIKSADFKTATIILEEIFQKNLVESKPSLEAARCLMFDMIGTIVKATDELEKGQELRFIDKVNPTTELMKCRTFSEMKKKMYNIIRSTCEYISARNERTDFTIRDQVVAIVERDYNDQNLSIASIAEKIDKYPYYISKIFKEQTGEGVLEYINRIRIMKAKEILKANNNNLTQEELCKLVGYTNVRTYQRALKKY